MSDVIWDGLVALVLVSLLVLVVVYVSLPWRFEAGKRRRHDD